MGCRSGAIPCGGASSGGNVLSRSFLPVFAHLDTPALIHSPKTTITITPISALVPIFPMSRDLFAEKVRKPDVHPDPADASHERAEYKDVESHPENSGHKSRHSPTPRRYDRRRHGRLWRAVSGAISRAVHDGQVASVPCGHQSHIRPASRTSRRPWPWPARSIYRPALSCQRARCDQRRITRARQARSQNRDEHEQDEVFGQTHGSVLTRLQPGPGGQSPGVDGCSRRSDWLRGGYP